MNGSGVTGSSASRISVTVGVVMTSNLRTPPRAINACARYGRTSRLRSFCAFCSTHFNGPRGARSTVVRTPRSLAEVAAFGAVEGAAECREGDRPAHQQAPEEDGRPRRRLAMFFEAEQNTQNSRNRAFARAIGTRIAVRGNWREIDLAMTTAHVTEMRLRLEPVSPDPFIHDLDQRRVRRDPPSTPDVRSASSRRALTGAARDVP